MKSCVEPLTPPLTGPLDFVAAGVGSLIAAERGFATVLLTVSLLAPDALARVFGAAAVFFFAFTAVTVAFAFGADTGFFFAFAMCCSLNSRATPGSCEITR